MRSARITIRAKRWQLATEEFQAYLAENRQHFRRNDALFYCGEAYVQLKRYRDARGKFVELVANDPEYPHIKQARFRVGETSYLAGDYSAAVKHLKAFIDRYGPDAFCEFAYPYLGEIALRRHEYDLAYDYYHKAIEEFPKSQFLDQCRYGAARASERLGESARARELYQPVAKQTDNALADDATLQLAILDFRVGKYQSVDSRLRSFDDTFPDSRLSIPAKYWRGLGLTRIDKWSSALEIFSAALAADEGHALAPALTFHTADALRHIDRTAEAKSHFRKVLTTWPNDKWADDSLQALTQMALDASRFEDVAALHSQFVEQYSESVLLPVVQQTLGRSLLKQDRFDEASDIFTKLLEGNTLPTAEADVATNVYLLALCHAGKEQHETTIQTLQSIRGEVRDAELIAAAALVQAGAHSSLEQYDAALADLDNYLKLQPNGPDADKCHAQRTVALGELGRIADARAALAQLTKHHADSEILAPTTYHLAENGVSSQGICDGGRAISIARWRGDSTIDSPKSTRRTRLGATEGKRLDRLQRRLRTATARTSGQPAGTRIRNGSCCGITAGGPS